MFLLCSFSKQTPFIVLSMALTMDFLLKYFFVPLQPHDLKLTVLVAIFVDLDPLCLKEVLVYADTVK